MLRPVFAMYILLAIPACAYVFEGELDDEDISTRSWAITTTSLAENQVIYADDTPAYQDINGVSQTFTLNAGESVYLVGKGTATSNRAEPMMDGLRIHCASNPTTYKQSTRNHVGTGAVWQVVRMLYTATSSGSHTCKLQALVGPRGGSPLTDYHTYLSGSSNTYINRSIIVTGWFWGTENDSTDLDYVPGGEPSDGIPPLTDGYSATELTIGEPAPTGYQDYALRSARFEVPTTAGAIDVYSEAELTTCYKDTGSCEDAVESELPYSQFYASQIDIRLVVQQMQSPTSGTVCRTTYSPASGFERVTITDGEHHKKAHLEAYDVTFDPACTGRSFIIKTQFRHVSGRPFRIEYGNSTNGYSTSFAFTNL